MSLDRDINARTRSLQLDAQQSFMPHISRMREDIQMYRRSFSNDKESDQFERLLLQMCNSTELLIKWCIPTRMVLHVENTMEIV